MTHSRYDIPENRLNAILRNMRARSKRKGIRYDFQPEDFLYCYNYFNRTCAVCGKTGGQKLGIDTDHWVPISKGGQSTRDNILLLCDPCNSHKSWLDPSEWLYRWYEEADAMSILDRVAAYFESLPSRRDGYRRYADGKVYVDIPTIALRTGCSVHVPKFWAVDGEVDAIANEFGIWFINPESLLSFWQSQHAHIWERNITRLQAWIAFERFEPTKPSRPSVPVTYAPAKRKDPLLDNSPRYEDIDE